MDAQTLLVWLIFFITCRFIYVLRFRSTTSGNRKLPPGPHPLPIIGCNLFQLRGVLHASLQKLSEEYGPLMSLKLGNRTAIVVSSPELAKELLQKNDLRCCSRSVPDTLRALDHHKVSVVWLPPTVTRWRSLRKLCRENLFSTERLDANQDLRAEMVRKLCDFVHDRCNTSEAVDIGEAAFTTSLNLIFNTLFSVDFGRYDSESSQEFKKNVWGVMKTVVAPNLADFFPVLELIDPQGLRRKMRFYMQYLLNFVENVIRERLQERGKSIKYSRKNDLLETLIDLIEDNEADLSYKDVRHLLLDLIIGGTETVSTMVEWGMAELIRNPEKMSKARCEIREAINGQTELLPESYISRLPYLQALVKEIFRLHPPGSLLVRQADADMEINQYFVSKDAQLIVNVWAIGRDEKLWSNPESFEPERFLNSEIDVKGQHFELLPFGTGRRICLGLPLGHRMAHLLLASLLHKFDWKLEDGLKPEDMDMTEKIGLTVQKATPLKAIPALI